MALLRRLLDRLGRQLERLGQRLRRRVAPVSASDPEPLPPEDAHAIWLAHVAHLSPESWSTVVAPVLDDTGREPIALARGASRVSAWPSRVPLPSPVLPIRQTVPSVPSMPSMPSMPSVPSMERPAPPARIDVSALSPRPDVVQQPLPAFPLHMTTEEGVRWPAPLLLLLVPEVAPAWLGMADPVVSPPAAPDWVPAEAVSLPLAWHEPDPESVPAFRGTETFTPAPVRPTPVPAPWPRLAPADALHVPPWWPRDVSPTPVPTWPPAMPRHRWPSLPPRTALQDDAAPDPPGRLTVHRHARLTAEQRG